MAYTKCPDCGSGDIDSYRTAGIRIQYCVECDWDSQGVEGSDWSLGTSMRADPELRGFRDDWHELDHII